MPGWADGAMKAQPTGWLMVASAGKAHDRTIYWSILATEWIKRKRNFTKFVEGMTVMAKKKCRRCKLAQYLKLTNHVINI